MLQEYINEFYVQHYDEFGKEANKITVLQGINESRNWIYKGKLGYVVDADGYVHYFLMVENMPEDIKKDLQYGRGKKTYSDYFNCKDVWGITEDLKVYYCADGQNSIKGVKLADLIQENGKDVVFSAGSNLAHLITQDDSASVTKSDLRGIQKIVFDDKSGLTNLNDLYNFTNLQDLTLQDLTLENLEGIEYLARVNKIYIIRCEIGDYSKLSEIAEQIQYLFLEDTTNEEVRKLCDNVLGIGGRDFPNLAYFGIYGKVHHQLEAGTTDDPRDDYGPVSATKHALFSEISYLSNLSTITKERITNLYLNNNSFTNIDNLWEFPNVERLRVEGNYLTTLKGIYNIEENKGMLNLKYLHAYVNYLGDSESDVQDDENDSLSIFLTKTFNEESQTYTYQKRFKNLRIVNLKQNKIIYLDYLKENDNLSNIYFDYNTRLNLPTGIQSMLPILEQEKTFYSCDQYVLDYINANSKKINTINLSDKTMKAEEFTTFLNDRDEYLKKLVMNKLVLTDNDGNILTNESDLTYDEVVNNSLKNLTSLIGFQCKENPYLTSINFVKDMDDLGQIDLRGTGVTDLQYLVDYCPSIQGVYVDNPNINVANQADANGEAEITAVEALFNKTYDNYNISLKGFHIFNATPGVVLANKSLIGQLSKSTNITKFRSGYYTLNYPTGEEDIIFDLSHTKITNCFWYRWPSSKKGDIFKLPSCLTKITWQNCEYFAEGTLAYRLDTDNAKTLISVETLSGSNCSWDTFWSTAAMLPNLEKIDYYYASITSSCSLEPYWEALAQEPIKAIAIYGAGSDYYVSRSTCGETQLKYLSQIDSLESVQLLHLSGLKNGYFLDTLANLEQLKLYDTSISSLSFLYKVENGTIHYNMPNLEELDVHGTSVGKEGYDKDGERVNNLEVLKNMYSQKLRTVNISGAAVSSADLNESGVLSLAWTKFTY